MVRQLSHSLAKRKDELIENLLVAYLSSTRTNLKVYAVSDKDLKSYATLAADIKKGKLKELDEKVREYS